MKRIMTLALAALAVASVQAADITALVRAAGAATVRRIAGTPYNEAGDFDVAALFDGSQGAGVTQRWLEGQVPSANKPIIIQYDIDGDFSPDGRDSTVVVKSFTLYNTYVAADAKTRAPAVFSLSASADGDSWTTLYAVDPDSPVTAWAASATDETAPRSHTFAIPTELQGDYRHYRFTVTRNNGHAGSTSASELVLEGEFEATEVLKDITADVRAAGAATVTRIAGTPYNDAGDYDVSALFDGGQGAGVTQRWLEGRVPSATSPIVIQYDIDEDFWPEGRPSEIVVKGFTLYDSYAASTAQTRAPAVFSLSASQDGVSWTELYAVDPDSPVTAWAASATDETAPRSHTFGIPASKRGNYRHYRFTVTKNNGDRSNTSASELVLNGVYVPYATPDGRKSAFADAAFWFRGATDRNSDGLLQSGEFSNALRLGVPNDATHGCTVVGAATEAQVVTEAVSLPFAGSSAETRVLALRPPVTQVEGKDAIQSGYVEPACRIEPKNVGPYSAVLRFSLDDFNGQDYKYVVSFGYDYSNAHGILLTARLMDAATGKFVPTLAFGQGKNLEFREAWSIPGFELRTNTWIDVAVTIGDGKATLYTCPAGGSFMAETKDLPEGLNTAKPAYNLRLGGSHSSTAPMTTGTDHWRSMNGRFAQVAVWDRCLSEDDVRQAFGLPRPDQWALGVANASSAEFAGGTSAATTVGSPDACAAMPPCLTAGNPTVTLTFAGTTCEAGLAQILRVVPTAKSSTGRLTATLNGTALGEADFAPAETTSFFAKRGLVRADANTLVLTLTSGDKLDVDAISMGGSFRLGEKNGTVWDKFLRTNREGASDAFDTYEGNIAEIPQQICSAGHKMPSGADAFSAATFRIHVDPSAAGWRHRFTARLRQTTLDGALPVRLALDGETVFSGSLAKNVFTDCAFTVPGLTAGDHLISCINDCPTDSDANFMADCYTLEILPPAEGMVLIFR